MELNAAVKNFIGQALRFKSGAERMSQTVTHFIKLFGIVIYFRRHDTQHNDNQPNDTKHDDIQQDDTQHNDIQHIDTQHNDTQHIDTQQNDTQHDDTQPNDTHH
jgi:hypothetical protein